MPSRVTHSPRREKPQRTRFPVREYLLKDRPPDTIPRDQVRLKASRPSKLRKGGGRKDSIGWTDQKRRSNRRRFDALRPHIQTAVTIIYPSRATPAQLAAFNRCAKDFCREHRVPARCVWEGPGFHQHIALGIPHNPETKRRWVRRLAKRWQREFGLPMPTDAFLWKPGIEPDRIASYLSKTWDKKRLMVKAPFAWLNFTPAWESGFRQVKQQGTVHSEAGKPRKKCVNSAGPPQPFHAVSPSYTVCGGQTPEKVREICPVCWRRWGMALWAGSCKCNPVFPNC